MFMTKMVNWYTAVKLCKHGFCDRRRISVHKILTMCVCVCVCMYIYIYTHTHTHTHTHTWECSGWLRLCTTKLEGHGFDSWQFHWNFSLTLSFRPHYGPGVDSASNRCEYQECFLGGKGSWCIGLTTLPPSCANCHEIWEPQPPGTLRACPGL